jgi:hypothetical protein
MDLGQSLTGRFTLAADQAQKLSTQEALRLLSADAEGLTSEQTAERLVRVGPKRPGEAACQHSP